MNVRALRIALLRFACGLAIAAIGSASSPALQRARKGHTPPLVMGEHEDEERDRNDEWFYEQRAYPFGSIPPDARRKAWILAQRIRARTPATKSAGQPERASKTSAPTRSWRSIGPSPTDSAIGAISPVSGRVRALAVSPVDAQIVIAGSAGGGLWRSSDAGVTWQPVSDDQTDLAVGAIAFAPSNPAIVYAAMGQEYLGSGVLRSDDAGQHWRRVSDDTLPTPGLAQDVAVDPTNADRVYVVEYAGLGDDGNLFAAGFYLSTDGGRSWRRTLAGLGTSVAIDASDHQKLYLGMSRVDEDGGRPAGIYRSTDAGLTWTLGYGGPFDASYSKAFRVATTAADPTRILAYAYGVINVSSSYRVVASTDAGRTWTPVGGQGLVASDASFLVVSPSDARTAFVGYPGGDTFRTSDGGAHWTCVTNGYCDGHFGRNDKTHVDQHSFAFSTASSSRVYEGNDGGIYVSDDSGESWRSLNQTLSLVTFRSVAISPANPSISVGGTQDNGSQRRVDGGSEWQEVITGDGGGVVFDPLDPTIYFTTYIYGTIFRWGPQGYDGQIADDATFGEVSGAQRIAFYPPFVGDGATSRLYFGTYRLFVSDDHGEHWSAPGGTTDLTRGAGTGDTLSAIGVGPATKDIVYTGSSQGRVMVSTNGGSTWRDISAGLPDRFVTGITVDRANSNIAYLTVSGFRAGHVFKTIDAGAHWMDISGELPDIPANATHQDPLDPNTIYLATDIGVFRSTSGGQAWESFSDGMPPALALGFSSHSSGTVQVATYGRGAYELGESGTIVDFGLGLSPDTLAIVRGAKQTTTLSVIRATGFTERVSIVPPSQPTKLKVKVTAVSGDASTYKVTVKAKRSTPAGSYELVFTGRSASQILRTVTLTVTVT